MHSALLFLVPHLPPHCHCMDHPYHLFSLVLWPAYWLNQSANTGGGTHIPLLWGFQILHATVKLHVWFIVCLPVIFTVNWEIQVHIPVEQIFSVRNAFRSNIISTFCRMAVDSFDLADTKYLSWYSSEVLCRQTLWARWSLWQVKRSRTIMLKLWLGNFDDLFGNWNVSYSGHLLVLSTRFLLCST